MLISRTVNFDLRFKDNEITDAKFYFMVLNIRDERKVIDIPETIGAEEYEQLKKDAKQYIEEMNDLPLNGRYSGELDYYEIEFNIITTNFYKGFPGTRYQPPEEPEAEFEVFWGDWKLPISVYGDKYYNIERHCIDEVYAERDERIDEEREERRRNDY